MITSGKVTFPEGSQGVIMQIITLLGHTRNSRLANLKSSFGKEVWNGNSLLKLNGPYHECFRPSLSFIFSHLIPWLGVDKGITTFFGNWNLKKIKPPFPTTKWRNYFPHSQVHTSTLDYKSQYALNQTSWMGELPEWGELSTQEYLHNTGDRGTTSLTCQASTFPGWRRLRLPKETKSGPVDKRCGATWRCGTWGETHGWERGREAAPGHWQRPQ